MARCGEPAHTVIQYISLRCAFETVASISPSPAERDVSPLHNPQPNALEDPIFELACGHEGNERVGLRHGYLLCDVCLGQT